MIIITKNKRNKNYKIPEAPQFPNRRLKIVWLKRQKMLATLSNIKSISIQVKDIKKMIYTKNPLLVSLYSKLCLQNRDLNDEDYITISKYNDLNKPLICALLSQEWLITKDEINHKSLEQLQLDCEQLQTQIDKLKHQKQQGTNTSRINGQIKLLEYKLSCLSILMQEKPQLTEHKSQLSI